MSESSIVIIVGAFLAALPPTLLAFAALRKGNQNGTGIEEAKEAIHATTSAVEDTTREMKDNTRKTDDVAKQATEIHTLVNSNASRLENDLQKARDEIKGLLQVELQKARDEITALRAYVTSTQAGATQKPPILQAFDEGGTAIDEAKIKELS